MLASCLPASAAPGEDKGNMLRGLAVEVGRVLGAASACPSVARPRISAISSRITAIIKSSVADPDETAADFRAA